MSSLSTPCPLAYCDPGNCGWRAKDSSCTWQDEAIDTTGSDDDPAECDCDD